MTDVIVGRFALIDLIAKGGSGSVWRAWDSKSQKLCAAKVLRQRDSADLMRFVREKGVSFDHPHLLTPYGWGAEDEHVVIAMPLVSGGTLESIVRSRGKLSEPTVVVILDQLLDGLALVHSQGWIHRDVKPANLMFEATGGGRPHSRLADFGIAVHESDVRFTHVGMVNGTPGYMAPELFSLAEPEPSHDIYAAGVVALMALNGPMKLHDGAFKPEELDRYLAGVSPKLNAVLRRMLASRPEDRYREAKAARRDLPRVPEGYPLTFADGKPFTIGDTMPPLPPNAPGSRPVQPQSRGGVPMDQVREGRMPPTSHPSASPQTGPQMMGGGPTANGYRASGPTPTGGVQTGWGQGGQQTSGSHATGSTATGPWTGQNTTGSSGQRPSGPDRRVLIAVAVGAVLAMILGVLAAFVLVRAFSPSSALGPGQPVGTSVVALADPGAVGSAGADLHSGISAGIHMGADAGL